MSRHLIASFSDRYAVIVGWDRPLNSFFAQVRDLQITDENEEDTIVLWPGTEHSEIPRPDDLLSLIAQYASISADMLRTLHADRIATLDTGDSQLQRDTKAITKQR